MIIDEEDATLASNCGRRVELIGKQLKSASFGNAYLARHNRSDPTISSDIEICSDLSCTMRTSNEDRGLRVAAVWEPDPSSAMVRDRDHPGEAISIRCAAACLTAFVTGPARFDTLSRHVESRTTPVRAFNDGTRSGTGSAVVPPGLAAQRINPFRL